MPTPREQAGGLTEASRLLQEGLQLLEQRRREVDAILEDARERALNIRSEAEAQARQITAEAEQHRAELEEQAAALRAEIAALREELAAARSANPVGGQVPPASFAEPNEADHHFTDTSDNTPQWGRRVTPDTTQRGSHGGGGQRRRWLPPWLPFVR